MKTADMPAAMHMALATVACHRLGIDLILSLFMFLFVQAPITVIP
ncbi:hypothetical protein [Novosphingobium resinovorum]|nr:hypothetical protein [Novosphingobium resinovorum]